MKMHHLFAIVVLAAVLGLASLTRADTISGTYGDVSVVGNNWQLTSSTTIGTKDGYASMFDFVNGALKLSQVTQLSADYTMTIGTFGVGAPRFSIGDSSFNEAWIYWGTPNVDGTFSDPVLGTTGNYADLSSLNVRVYNNGFGGQNTPNTGETWAQFVAAVGDTAIRKIYLDLDGGWGQSGGTQQMLVSDFRVNDKNFTPEAVPTPNAAVGGLALFGVIGLVKLRRRGLAA